jgi:hypothetical protein
MMRAAACVLVVTACLAAPGVSYARAPITVRVYDSTNGSARERASAIAAAAAIFADAGMDIAWRDCGRNGVDYPCAGGRQPHDLVVRIVPRAVAADPLASNAVTADANADTERDAAMQPTLRLGAAAVTATDHAGVVATVYAEHVRQVTERTGVPFTLLLGRAIAHEVGHLLPGGVSGAESRGDDHSPSGLMRAVWTDGELRLNRAEDWAYFPAVAPVRTTRSSGSAVDGSNRVVPGGAPLD